MTSARFTHSGLHSCYAIAVLLLLLSLPASADRLNIAVAANFYGTALQLAENFERNSGVEVTLIKGSSGKLATQIRQGAPFDLFLSADTDKPRALIDSGLALRESYTVYAYGQLVLYSKRYAIDAPLTDFLRREDIRTLAIANPKLAPYGKAAEAVLATLGLSDFPGQTRLAAENVAHALLYVDLGSADAGFVAQSLLIEHDDIDPARALVVNPALYPPIAQALVIANKGNRAAAQRFIDYLQQPASRELLKQAGYQLPQKAQQ